MRRSPRAESRSDWRRVSVDLHARSRLTVESLSLDDPRWSTFVASQPSASVFQLPSWSRVLVDTYGYRAFALVAEDRDGISAGTTVFEIRRPFGGRRWISVPFADHAEPVGSADGIEAIVEALHEESGAGVVSAVEFHADVGGPSRAVGTRHVLRLDDDPDAVFARFKKTQVRQPIAKAERERTVVATVRLDREAVVETFFRLHVATRRRLGVPVQPRSFFEHLWRETIAAGHGFTVVAEAHGHPVAAAVFLSAGRDVTYKFSASDSRSWSLRPNNVVLWTAIKHGCERGFEMFDFGRTELGNEGLRAFKSGWGGEELGLRYTTFGAHATLNDEGTSPHLVASAARAVIRRSPSLVGRAVGQALYRYAA